MNIATRTKEPFFTSSSTPYWKCPSRQMVLVQHYACDDRMRKHYNHEKPKTIEVPVSDCTVTRCASAARRYHPRTMLFGRHQQPRTPHGSRATSRTRNFFDHSSRSAIGSVGRHDKSSRFLGRFWLNFSSCSADCGIRQRFFGWL